MYKKIIVLFFGLGLYFGLDASSDTIFNEQDYEYQQKIEFIVMPQGTADQAEQVISDSISKHYFDTGLTRTKITEKIVNGIKTKTIETWITKNASYLTVMNGLGLGLALASAAVGTHYYTDPQAYTDFWKWISGNNDKNDTCNVHNQSLLSAEYYAKQPQAAQNLQNLKESLSLSQNLDEIFLLSDNIIKNGPSTSDKAEIADKLANLEKVIENYNKGAVNSLGYDLNKKEVIIHADLPFLKKYSEWQNDPWNTNASDVVPWTMYSGEYYAKHPQAARNLQDFKDSLYEYKEFQKQMDDDYR